MHLSRLLSVLLVELVFFFIVYLSTAQAQEFGLVKVSCGCHKGYRWASCGIAAPGGHEWCHTTYEGGSSGDRAYQQCTRNDQCYYDRKCTGPCSL